MTHTVDADITEQLIQRLEETMEINAQLNAQLDRYEKLLLPDDLPEIQMERIDTRIPLPSRGSAESAGWDLHAAEAFSIWPDQRVSVPLGIRLAIPRGFAGLIWLRSGLGSKHGLHRLAGLIDSDYRGEVRAVLVNLGERRLEFEKGERICQLVVVPCLQRMIEVTGLGDTERGDAGFGSTGI